MAPADTTWTEDSVTRPRGLRDEGHPTAEIGRPANAWADVAPKVPMATAMASSKLLPAAVNATDADWA